MTAMAFYFVPKYVSKIENNVASLFETNEAPNNQRVSS